MGNEIGAPSHYLFGDMRGRQILVVQILYIAAKKILLRSVVQRLMVLKEDEKEGGKKSGQQRK